MTDTDDGLSCPSPCGQSLRACPFRLPWLHVTWEIPCSSRSLPFWFLFAHKKRLYLLDTAFGIISLVVTDTDDGPSCPSPCGQSLRACPFRLPWLHVTWEIPCSSRSLPFWFLFAHKKRLYLLDTAFGIISLVVTYFHMGRPHTIIGDTPFHF